MMASASNDQGNTALCAFARRLDLDDRLEPFHDRRWHDPDENVPVLHLEDVSAIPFLSGIAGVEEYQHRARVRAYDGDMYATVTPTDPAYEAYCRDRLNLGDVRWFQAEGGNEPLAVARACQRGETFDRLVDATKHSRTLLIHPYMAIDDVWELGAHLAQGAGAPVAILGPPPPVTWIANDKALFTELVDLVLGPGWTPETHQAGNARQIAETLQALARRYPLVGLKRTRCASATGNAVFDSKVMRQQPPATVEDSVREFLRRTEWPDLEPVLIVAWEETPHSPSTQWWLPPPETAPPRLDGIYEQILQEDRKLFVGSRPSTLPDRVNQTLAHTAQRVATALQTLGYVGRCSFDHLVLGDPNGDFTVRFTECNGRWGGTSTPMLLVDRVVRGARPPYRAQDFVHPNLAGLDFSAILASVGDAVFDHRTQRGRYIFYNVGPLRQHGKLDVVALGSTQDEAEHALSHELPRLLGL